MGPDLVYLPDLEVMKMENEKKKVPTVVKIVRIISLLLLVNFALIVFPLIGSQEGNEDDIDIDNFKIEELTDDQIVNSGTYQSWFGHQSNTGGGSGIDHIGDRDYDCNRCVRSAKLAKGIILVSCSLAKDERLTINISSKLISGNMKIVIIEDQSRIVEYAEVGKSITLNYDVVGEHRYDVKVLCEEAEFEIVVERSFE